MTQPLNTKRNLRTVAILVIVVCLLPLMCNYGSLLLFAIRLYPPMPPGSSITTKLYRTAWFPNGYLVWERHYRIPVTEFVSTDAVEQYFDEWLLGHEWETSPFDPCFLAGGTTVLNAAMRIRKSYLPSGHHTIYEYRTVCLMLNPKPYQGYYDVWLITFNPALVTSLED